MNYKLDKYSAISNIMWAVYCLRCNRQWVSYSKNDLINSKCCYSIPKEMFDKRNFLNKLQKYI